MPTSRSLPINLELLDGNDLQVERCHWLDLLAANISKSSVTVSDPEDKHCLPCGTAPVTSLPTRYFQVHYSDDLLQYSSSRDVDHAAAPSQDCACQDCRGVHHSTRVQCTVFHTCSCAHPGAVWRHLM